MNTEDEDTYISMPNLLMNPAYLEGMQIPLEHIAEILDDQDRPEHALMVRYAAHIVRAYTSVNVIKSHKLIETKQG